jgi:hypothetical protein
LTLLAGVLSASSNNSTLNDVEPGLLGFLVVFFIGVALFFLLRSMNKQLHKLPPPEDPDAPDTAETDASGASETDANAEDAKRG